MATLNGKVGQNNFLTTNETAAAQTGDEVYTLLLYESYGAMK